MAKKKTGAREKIAMVSESGFMYTTTKNKRNTETKLELKKFDPWLRKIVAFKEKKIPK